MNITESNKVIAEFLGYNVVDKPRVVNGENFFEYFDEEKGYSICGTSLKFHYSWNHLMPVVEKIEMLGYTFEKNYQKIDGDWQSLIVKGSDILFQEFNRDSKLSTCYVVAEFIQWYKNQN